MFVDRAPNEVILFCDKMTGKCLVRLVDARYDDILSFGVLPGLCRVSDLIVKVLPITSFDVEDRNLVANDKIVFRLDSDNRCVNIDVVDYDGVSDIDARIRMVFGVEFYI